MGGAELSYLLDIDSELFELVQDLTDRVTELEVAHEGRTNERQERTRTNSTNRSGRTFEPDRSARTYESNRSARNTRFQSPVHNTRDISSDDDDELEIIPNPRHQRTFPGAATRSVTHSVIECSDIIQMFVQLERTYDASTSGFFGLRHPGGPIVAHSPWDAKHQSWRFIERAASYEPSYT